MMAQLRLALNADLEGAEDLAGVLAKALQDVLDAACGFDATRRALDALAEFSGYCRPSCGYLDDGECHAEDPARCGCFCGHADNDDPIDRPTLRRHDADHPPARHDRDEQLAGAG